MRLKDLLLADIACYLDSLKNTVLARESIHFMLFIYSERGALRNSRLIHARDVVSFLRIISKKAEEKHYQLVVESGERSPRHQGDHDTVHYSAMDVYSDAEGHLVVVIADHYHGAKYHSYRKEYAALTDFPVHFVVMGSTLYQADNRHCPIFTLHHLLLTAHDDSLPLLYRQAVATSMLTSHVTYLPWYSLPPAYLLGMQSFTALVKYVDHVKMTENGVLEEESKTLADAAFDKHLAVSLKCNLDLDMKIQNRYIEHRKEVYLEEISVALNEVSDEILITICYKDQPVMLQILTPSSSASCARSVMVAQDHDHPLLPLIFSNQPLSNFLDLKNFSSSKKSSYDQLLEILTTPSLLFLAQKGLIDPQKIFMHITHDDYTQRKLRGTPLQLLYKNITVMDALAAELVHRDDHAFTAQNVLELIFHKNAMTLFTYEPIKKFYFEGKLTNTTLLALRLDKLKTLLPIEAPDEHMLATLALCRQEPSPVSVSTCLSPTPSACTSPVRQSTISCTLFASPSMAFTARTGMLDEEAPLEDGIMGAFSGMMFGNSSI